MNDWRLSEAYQQQKSEVLTLELGNALYEHFCTGSTTFTSDVQQLRKAVFSDTGVYLPPIRIRRGELPDHEYRILMRGQAASQGSLEPTAESKENLLKEMRRLVHTNLHHLISYQDTVKWLNEAKQQAPELVNELQERGLSPGLLWSVICILVKKRHRIYPFEQLLEWILDYYLYHPYQGYIPPQWTHYHPEEIANYIMKKRSRAIVNKEPSNNNVMRLPY